MIQDFIKHSAIYGLGKIIMMIVGLCTIPIITQTLSPESYGIFDLLNLCLVLLNLSVAMEISQAVARFIADAKDKSEKRNYVSTAYYFSLIMYSICALGLCLFQAPLAGLVFKDDAYSDLILYLIPWLFLHGTTTFISNQFRWENKPKQQVTLQITLALSLLVSVLHFLLVQIPSVENLIHAYLASQVVTLILGIIFIIRHRIMDFSFSMLKLKTMLLFSLPLVPSSLAVFAQNYIDRAMISQMLDFENLGLYSLAFKIVSFLTVFAGIFQLSAVPLIYKHHKDDNASQNFAETANIYLFLLLTCIIGLGFFMPEAYYLFIGMNYSSSIILIPILLFAVGFQSFYTFAPGLGIAKKTHHIATINIIGMILNALLNYVLIIKYGLLGAAIATCISAILICIININISQKHFFIAYRYTAMIEATILTTISVASIYAMNLDITLMIFTAKALVALGIIGIIGYLLLPRNIFDNFKTTSS